MDVRSAPDRTGRWVCRLEYDEIPECVAESTDPLEALEELEAKRIAWITREMQAGRPVPSPRLPLGEG